MAGKNTPAPEPAPAPEPESAPAPEPASAPDVSALNQQIVQAVDKTNFVLMGAAGPEANGVAYQKVAQAAAFSVQDSTDYLRNIMTIAATVQGVCLQLMIKTPPTAAEYTPIIEAAQKAVTKAEENFAAVGAAAGEVVGEFPSS